MYRDRREANGQRGMENENPMAREQANARRRERERCDGCQYQSACKRGFYVSAPSQAPCRGA